MCTKILFLLLICFNVFAFEAIVTDVHDGDTIKYKFGNQVFKGRLMGIDAPEINQEHGINSRDYLRFLILDKSVDIEIINVDKYKRNVIKIKHLDIDINKKLVISGNAWAYEQYSDVYVSDQLYAEDRKFGLWAFPNPTKPSIWRRTNGINTTKLECKTNNKILCSTLKTCNEAYFWLDECNYSYLDSNGDGVPCESLCK